MRRQGLGRSANDYGDGGTGSFLQYLRARRFGDGADAVEEHEIPVKWDLEVGSWASHQYRV